MQDENKRRFISALESALIMYTRENIKALEYIRTEYDEYMTIKFTTGFEKTIDITGDSCLGIMKDLVRGLE